MKKLVAVLLAVVICVMCAMPAFAGNWELQGNGKWMWMQYNPDGSYSFPVSSWWWIDDNGDGAAECYCFDANGYLRESELVGGQYWVNYDGAWADSPTTSWEYTEFCKPWAEWFDSWE